MTQRRVGVRVGNNALFIMHWCWWCQILFEENHIIYVNDRKNNSRGVRVIGRTSKWVDGWLIEIKERCRWDNSRLSRTYSLVGRWGAGLGISGQYSYCTNLYFSITQCTWLLHTRYNQKLYIFIFIFILSFALVVLGITVSVWPCTIPTVLYIATFLAA